MNPNEIPVLLTGRLTLRGHTPDDLAQCVALWSDAEVTRYIGGRPFTVEEVWTRMLRYVGHWALLGFGYWLVSETASGAFVGEVGFANFQRDLTPSFGAAPEAGWIIAPSARGRGYAMEALSAAHSWINQVYGAQRSVCMIDHDNVISQRIAAKLGYSEWAHTTYKATPVALYERTT